MKNEKLSVMENVKNLIDEKSLILTMKERVILPEILPQNGSKLQQILVRSLISKIEFSQSEIQEFEIQFTQTGINWNKRAIGRTFSWPVSAAEISILKQASAEFDKNGKVTQFNLSLIEQIDEL